MRRLPHLLLLVAAAACERSATARTSQLVEIPTPVAVRSGEPFLFVDARDRIHLTWRERTGDSSHAVRYARLDGETWTTPSTIVERHDLFVNWADFPAVVATPSGRLVAHWLQRGGSGKYAYDVHVAASSDSGVTWSGDQLLHRDVKGTGEHGFVALWSDAADSVHAAWLDGRNMGAGHGESRGAMTVQTTAIAPDGSLGAEQPLDLRTCECCQVNAAVGSGGPIVVYRDRTEDEIRDIGVVRLVNGAWSSPARVHADNWHVEGCPVNGPAIVAHGDTAAVAWFTGARDTARVQVAWSVDGGATFGTPIRVDGGSPVGRVDIELLPEGSAAVSWLERVPPDRGEVRVRRVQRSGRTGAPFTIASTSASRPSGFPKLVRRGTDLVAAWTVPGDSARVRLGRIAIADLP